MKYLIMEEFVLFFFTLNNIVICESWRKFELNKLVRSFVVPGVSRRFNALCCTLEDDY